MRRRLLVPLLAALVLAVPGCGGEEAPGEAADLLRADTALFVALDTDFDGEQWNQVEALVERFPDGDRLAALILDELRQEGIDFEREVRPALGPEVDFAVLELEGAADDQPVVALTQPEDPAKLAALVERAQETGEEELVVREVDGWHAVASSEEALDRALAGEGETLAGSDTFEAAMEALPDDALVRVYADGERAMAALEARGGVPPTGGFGFLSVGRPVWLAAAASAEEEGVRVELVEEAEDAEEFPTYEATFVSDVPGDALAFVSFNGQDEAFRRLRDSLGDSIPDFDRQLAQLEAALGVSLEEDVLPLLAGEGALYVRPGAPIPEVTLVLEAEDEQQALATLDRLADAAARVGGARRGDASDVAGVEVHQVALGGFPAYYAVFDGKAVVTTAVAGIRDLREEGDKLADHPRFEEAKDAAGMPDETTGFVYVDVEELASLVLGFASVAGAQVPPAVRENLEPVRTLILYGEQEDERTTLSGLVRID